MMTAQEAAVAEILGAAVPVMEVALVAVTILAVAMIVATLAETRGAMTRKTVSHLRTKT